MSRCDLAWLAGLLEGEGWFYTQDRRPDKTVRFEVGLQMTDEDVVRRAHQVAGVGSVYGPYDKGENRQPIYRWQVRRREDVLGLLCELLPYMGYRRSATIEEMVSWIEQTLSTRESMPH